MIHQYSSQPYYYSYNEYPSSPLLSPMSYTTTLPRDQYTSSLKYYDDEETFISERYRHSHRSHHRQYSNQQKSSRAHNISR